MPLSFNLIDESWIPTIDGHENQALHSLYEALARAPDLREVAGESAMVTIALYRLLLAVLYRVFEPRMITDWKAVWNLGHFDQDMLRNYFERWRARFDLFDTDRPFFQVGDFPAAAPNPVSRLSPDLSGGNNPTLFDHTLDGTPNPMGFAAVARLLVANQATVVGGGNSPTGYTSAAPLAKGMAVIVEGDNLFETLMLNLVPYESLRGILREKTETDLPVWEADAPIEPGRERYPLGISDYLTWQSRAIRLRVDDQAANDGAVLFIDYGQGVKLPDNFDNDPMMAYTQDRKRGTLARRLRENRDLWRDSGALLRDAETEDRRETVPDVTHFVANLTADQVLESTKRKRIAVIGQCSDRAKVFFWRHERLPLPLALLNDDELMNQLNNGLLVADQVGKLLRYATKDLARALLRPEDPTNADPKQVAALADSFQAGTAFWAGLELPFRRFMADLPDRPEEEFKQWASSVISHVRETWNRVVTDLGGSARAFRAAATVERKFLGNLKKTEIEGGLRDE